MEICDFFLKTKIQQLSDILCASRVIFQRIYFAILNKTKITEK